VQKKEIDGIGSIELISKRYSITEKKQQKNHWIHESREIRKKKPATNIFFSLLHRESKIVAGRLSKPGKCFVNFTIQNRVHSLRRKIMCFEEIN
jgi:hypothetical protein